jgi:4-amino-4-deoxy-L-arabinose transferase-like glycosyltransferase
LLSIRAFDLSGGLDAILDRLSASHRRAALALVVAALICFLPGIASLPPTNRDESRFALPTRQLIETGNPVDFHAPSLARYRKPIGIYWLQAAIVHLAETAGIDNARGRILFYRIPSLFGAIGAVLLTYWAALAFLTRRYALLAALALATSILLGIEARLATADALLLVTAIAAQGALARVYLGAASLNVPPPSRDWPLAALFWTAVAGSFLLKGLIVPLIVALSAASLVAADRSARWLRRLHPVAGVLWVLLLMVPLFLAVPLRPDGGSFVLAAAQDLFGRILPGPEGHIAPPGYYWLLSWVLFWPFAPLAVLATAFGWTHRREPAVRFLLAWIVPGWLMLEIIVNKYPHHMLVFAPAVAILVAFALERGTPVDRWTQATTSLWPVLAILLPIAAILLVVLLDGRFGKAFWPFAAIGIAFGALAWWRLMTGTAERALVLALIASMAMSIAVFTVLPRIRGIAVAPRLVAAAQAAPCPSPLLASAGYREPNLAFLGGPNTSILRGAEAADFLRLGACRVAFVERGEERAFADRAAAIGLTSVRIGEVGGFNYSNLRWLSFVVLMAREGG